MPASLNAVMDSLEADHEFLLEGGVFTGDLIETWIDYKRTQEIQPVALRPHPHEFELYYDILALRWPLTRRFAARCTNCTTNRARRRSSSRTMVRRRRRVADLGFCLQPTRSVHK